MARPGHPCYDAAECDLRGDFSTFKASGKHFANFSYILRDFSKQFQND